MTSNELTRPKLIFVIAFTLCVGCSHGQLLRVERVGTTETWIDPALNPTRHKQSIVVWFDMQFLGKSDSFLKRTKEFKGKKRSVLRKQVIETLKSISSTSYNQVKEQLTKLEQEEHLSQLKSHWVINGFSCDVDKEGFKAISELKGVAKIFKKQPLFKTPSSSNGPQYITSIPGLRFEASQVESVPWNIEKIKAPDVWNEYGITGEGTLNIMHDFGFKLDVPPLAETIYINEDEIPGNGLDDDDNGYVDDYHGYNFDEENAEVNKPGLLGTLIHGNACAGIIAGSFATNTNTPMGIAPGSKWAPVIGIGNIEQAIEWSIEQGADTYTMSFSHPNIGELRTHWRKIMEQATFCGVVFISGAGNFAGTKGFAPIPVQMRSPEDIPEAVLGVAGVDQEGNRPEFSSQGPVKWNTHYYKDGTVNKPDFATLNKGISCIDLAGNLSNKAGGNSFSGPHMAGIVSLMLSANSELQPWEVKEILKATAKDIGAEGFDYQTGHGFVNAYDAVTRVLKLSKTKLKN